MQLISFGQEEVSVRDLGGVCTQAPADIRKTNGSSHPGEMAATGRIRTETWKRQHFRGRGRKTRPGGREVREDQEKVPDMQSFSEGATGVAGSSREVRQARVGLVVRNLTPLIGDHRWGFTQGAWCSREPVPQTVPFPVTC